MKAIKGIKKKPTRASPRASPRPSASPAKKAFRQPQTFEPTPAEAWGSALRQYNAPQLSGRRWLPPAAADENAAPVPKKEPLRLMDDPNFDWEMVVLDGWSFSYNGSRPLQLTGKVFNSAGGFEEGDLLEYTSQVISAKGRVVKTKSGTSYYLGEPGKSFGPIRMQLIRQAGIDPRTEPLDEANPLERIEFGHVVPSQTIKMPKVPGWRHDSTVALLHDWKITRASGFVTCTGIAFNCPGAHDGEEGHVTADIIDVKGRYIKTVDGIAYLLGRELGDDATGTEEEPLGPLDDLLSV